MRFRYKVLGVLAVPLLFVLIPGSTKFDLGNGGHVRIRKASFVRSLFSEANATVSYTSKSGQSGSIVLWQDPFDGVVTVIPDRDTNVLLCLYDFDIGFRLFRVDTSQAFRPITQECDLKHILFTCSWDIKEGTTRDWQEVLSYLQTVSSSAFAYQCASVSFRDHSPQSLLASLAYQGVTPLPKNYFDH